MTDDTWEARMAARAADRAAARVASRAPDPPDQHTEHHTHLDGNALWCSCGQFRGITTVVVPDEPADPATLSCSECGLVGVVRLGGDPTE